MSANNASSPARLAPQEVARPVSDTIRTRHCTREFLDREVAREDIEQILETASYAPSGSNFQPWKVYVLTGSTLKRVGNAVRDAFLNDEPGHARDYAYYPKEHFEPYNARRRECGLGLYKTLKIGREEKLRMKETRSRNYVFFNAPAALIFTLDDRLEAGSFLDYGFFIQSILLAAREMGIDSCPQASIGEYPNIVRRELGLDASERILCGAALGYEDKTQVINSFSPPRAQVSAFATFLG
jgi:nitroreductase